MSSDANLTHVVRLLPSPHGAHHGDPELLDRYVRERDQDAFAILVRRYGPLVFGVARRQLADRHRCEDVFQATFLALARSAARLGGRPALTNWLYTVALRLARKVRAQEFRSNTAENAEPADAAFERDPLAEITGRELVRVVDDELARLPERLRLPILLCCVQGLSREEAAQRLGWSPGSVKGRLERGRQKLAVRLAARGLAPSAVLLAPLAAVTVPADLLARTVASALAPWARSASPAVAALAAAGMRRLLPPAVLAACFVTAVTAGVFALMEERAAQPLPPAGPVKVPPKTVLVPDDPLPTGATGRFGSTRFRHPTEISELCVSADGKFAVASSDRYPNGAHRAYDLNTGRALFTLEGWNGDRFFTAVAVSPDGRTLATNQNGTLRLHDAATGKEKTRINYVVPAPGVKTRDFTFRTSKLLVFAPDCTHVLIAAGDGNALVLVDPVKTAEFESVQVSHTFPHNQLVHAAAFSPDGKRMVGGGEEQDKGVYFARLWNAETGKEQHRLWFGKGKIRCVAFSPDGATVAVGGDGENGKVTVTLFEAATGKERLQLPFPNTARVRSVAFSLDGKTLAASGSSYSPGFDSFSGDGTTRLFEVATGKEALTIDRTAIGLRFAPDGGVLVGAVANAIYRWDTTTGKALTPEGPNSQIESIAVAPDGSRIVARELAGAAHVWNARSGKYVPRLSVGWGSRSAVSPDGHLLVWLEADKTATFTKPSLPGRTLTGSRLRTFDLTAGAFVERFDGIKGGISRVCFTADSKALVTSGSWGTGTRFWDVATGKLVRSFLADEKEQPHGTSCSALSPNGKIFADATYSSHSSASAVYAVRLWDTETGKKLHDLSGHTDRIGAVAFSPDGKYLVTGEPPYPFKWERRPRAGHVFVWEVATGRRVASLPIEITAVAFAPDGKALAVAVADGTIQLWDAGTWQLSGEFPGPREWVTALTFGPDGRLFSGATDAEILAWDLRAAKRPSADRK
ncbi:ECF RNA polymerase sigma-E factor [Gemmata obscuriglobus]|uniref:Uncharacterized protein n=1 Tax=Gemmata obscuriglobus TaxID=114 RepID=A0A2Z3H7J4_9BACT|nr:sigma-70 family RNA polymerase sigma factor [Gemmata obscuriglobus]AWM39507.1 hypothetical protein C1280_22600 [Gemmata obscuriglobus]QEG27402.1 ECF RNA polymerase sigma-E factor [Gemmata obscuriglobus]VTS04319.1 (myosin heavy-chain) kinase : Uncultured bacterium genome assembly Metasoil_fosmids_resub OS=uncultured bacterium PE=4 SV=1: Sigma70_r2: Sigma70_r4_2: WD40: WD40: WD40 [Gemmata obscuriglobus UQM 2246]